MLTRGSTELTSFNDCINMSLQGTMFEAFGCIDS